MKGVKLVCMCKSSNKGAGPPEPAQVPQTTARAVQTIANTVGLPA